MRLNALRAKAKFEGEEHKLNVRVAEHESAFWYDLGDCRAVRIDERGWEIVDDPPILFKSFPHQKVQVEPVQTECKDIHRIFHYVRLRDDEGKLLFIVNLVTSPIPDISHPIDNFNGPKGACKSTACKVKKELVDPSILTSLSPPQNMVEFIQTASHHWVISLDNLSTVPDWLSNTLCRLVTGDGFSKRKNEDKPKILGALFTLLSRAMAEYPRVELLDKPRMADFAHWGCAVARALGKSEQDFIKAYQANIGIQNEEALEASPIAQVVMMLMKDRGRWEGKPSILFHDLKMLTDDHKIDHESESYPKAPNMVWKKLKEVIPNLKEVGIECTRDDSSRASSGRKIVIVNHRFKEGSNNPEAGVFTGIEEAGKCCVDFEEFDRLPNLDDST